MEVISPKIFDASVMAFITTRKLNLGANTKAPLEVIVKNRALLSNELKGMDIVCGSQIHGDEVYIVSSDDRGRGWLKPESAIKNVDAFVTNKKNLLLTVFLADCAGVLLYDPVRKAVGAVHSGWRGTKKKIVNKTLRIMQEMYGSKPTDIKAFLSPCIRSCCYVVKDDVKNAFADYAFAVDTVEGGYSLDLPSIIVVDMLKAGVLERNIELSHLCTSCSNDLLFSYRKEGEDAGRIAAMIGLL